MRKIKVRSLVMAGLLSLSMAIGSAQAAYAGERTVDKIFINESSYETAMKNTVEPYIGNAKESGYLDVGQANFKVYYEKYKVKNAKGNIVLSHGFTESLEKYHEMIYYFMNEGYSVYGLEHRGHGRSGNLGIDKYQVNVDKFEDYVSDLKVFLDKVVRPETCGQKLFLFAHSMGGGIGTRFLEQYNNYFDAAILSAPMMEVNTGEDMDEGKALLVTAGAIAANLGDNYVMNQGPYKDDYNFAEAATSSEKRYAYSHNVIKSTPVIQRGGASYKWLNAAIKGTINVRSEARDCVTPVLLFKAGNDGFVKPGGQDVFAASAKNCTVVEVPGSKHEIYMEKDEILKPYLQKVMSFYAQH